MSNATGRLAGKIAIVTGGAMGIGRATALRLAADGATVMVADLQEAQANDTVKAIIAAGGKAAATACNVASEDAVRAMVEGTLAKFGRIDILANVAGVTNKKAPVDEMTLEEFRRVTTINLEGTFLCVKYVARAMKQQKYGRIVNVSSTTSIMPTTYGNTAYTASKGAVSAMTRQWVLDLAEHGITGIPGVEVGVERVGDLQIGHAPGVIFAERVRMLGRPVC